MATFSIAPIEAVQGRQQFFKLIVNDTCPFDEFWQIIEQEGNLANELIRVISIMNQVAEMRLLPKTMFRELEGRKKSDNVKEYEVKTANLRVYLFHEEKTGKIVVCGGKKNTQPADIRQFRSLKKQYFEDKNK